METKVIVKCLFFLLAPTVFFFVVLTNVNSWNNFHRLPLFALDLISSHSSMLFVFVLFEFRSFRSVRTIAGPGGVIGPLPRPNEGGRTTGNKVAKKAEYIHAVRVFTTVFTFWNKNMIEMNRTQLDFWKSVEWFKRSMKGSVWLSPSPPPPPPWH